MVLLHQQTFGYIKAPLKEKKRAFVSRNTEDLGAEEHQLRRRIGEGRGEGAPGRSWKNNIRKTNMRKMKARKVQMASAPGSRYPVWTICLEFSSTWRSPTSTGRCRWRLTKNPVVLIRLLLPLQFSCQPGSRVEDTTVFTHCSLTWRELGALRGSCSLIYPVPLTPSSSPCWETSWDQGPPTERLDPRLPEEPTTDREGGLLSYSFFPSADFTYSIPTCQVQKLSDDCRPHRGPGSGRGRMLQGARMLDKLSPIPEQLSHPLQDTLSALGCSVKPCERETSRHRGAFTSPSIWNCTTPGLDAFYPVTVSFADTTDFPIVGQIKDHLILHVLLEWTHIHQTWTELDARFGLPRNRLSLLLYWIDLKMLAPALKHNPAWAQCH